MVSITTDIGAIQNGIAKEVSVALDTEQGKARTGY